MPSERETAIESIAAMINCSVFGLVGLGSQLTLWRLALDTGLQANSSPTSPIAGAQRERVLGWLKVAESIAQDFEMAAVLERIAAIRTAVERNMSCRHVASDLRVLEEMLGSGLQDQFIYRYSNTQTAMLDGWKADWAPVLSAFPSAAKDVLAGVDLWALSHPTASVFQFMRVLEHGLRALAHDLGLIFDVQTWGTVLDQIEAAIRKLGPTLPAGPAKSDRLRFLSEAAKEFVYFKDGWRNFAAHGRGTYDETQGRIVMEHVRSFMTVLAGRLVELPV